jgi:hypothetical protein
VFLFIAAMAKKIVIFIVAMVKKIVIPSEAEGPCVFSFLSRTLRKRGSREAATATTTHVATGDSPVRRGSAAPPQPRSGTQECSPRRQPWIRMHRRTSPEGVSDTSPKTEDLPA